MNASEQLVAWANLLPDDFVKRAVRDANHRAINNADGDVEHIVFVNELIAALGLKRINGRPRMKIDAGPVALAIVVKRGLVTDHKIAEKLAGMFNVSPNTMRARMSEAEAAMEEGRHVFGCNHADFRR